MRRNPTMDEAREVFRADYQSEKSALKIRDTGLMKVCPRCHRRGWIFLFSYGAAENRSAVVWEGKALGGKRAADIDGCRPDELFRPTFGCGVC